MTSGGNLESSLPPGVHLRWFSDSPDAGSPECICPLYGNPITEEDAPAIRFFDMDMEARFHDDCFHALFGEAV